MSGSEDQISLKYIENETFDVAITTGQKVVFNPSGQQLLIDAHFHIQSNSLCCPLPLMWGLTVLNLGEIGSAIISWLKDEHIGRGTDKVVLIKMQDSIETNFFLGDFGKLSRLSTDLIAKVFMGTVKNNDMKKKLYWTIQYRGNKNEAAGRKAKLEDLATARQGKRDGFFKDTAYYYKYKDGVHEMFYTLPMDLSYSHFWGKFGIPVYLPMPIMQGIYYINDFIQISVLKDLTSKELVTIPDVITPTDEEVSFMAWSIKSTHLYYDHEIKRELAIFLNYLWAKANKKNPEEDFNIYFDDNEHIADGIIQKINSLFGPNEDEVTQINKDLTRLEEKYLPHLNDKYSQTKKYVHFINKAPGESSERFEGYQKQFFYTEASAVRFPFKITAFYHYDPRRHFKNSTADIPAYRQDKKQINNQINDIINNHAFFNYTIKYKDFSFLGFGFKGNFLSLTPAYVDETYLRWLFVSENMKTNNDNIFKQMIFDPDHAVHKGLFWGFKMYPALGYHPKDITEYNWDYDDDAKFPNFTEFYQYCCDNKIPVIVHCGPRGMTIADAHNYSREEENKRKNIHRQKYELKECIDELDDQFSQPSNWKQLLYKFPDLKLCLAHFGGNYFWNKNREEKAEWKDRVDWRDEIISIMYSYNYVFTDLAYITNDYPEEMADQLVNYLNKCFQLKNRLLVGSDWLMIEMGKFKGTGEFNRRMFEMLKLVSREVGYDAWYQFAVINPLKFLGLIDPDADPDGKTLGELDVNGKLYDYFLYICDKVDDSVWRQFAEVKESETYTIKTEARLKYNTLKNSIRIYNSDQIKDPENPYNDLILKE